MNFKNSLYHIITLFNFNFLGIILFTDNYFGLDSEFYIGILLLLFAVQHRMFDNLNNKGNRFLLENSISISLAIVVNYIIIEPEISAENHKYIFYVLLGLVTVFINYKNLRENGPNAKSDLFNKENS